MNNWIRKYFLSLSGYSLIFLFLFFYSFNIFTGEKSLFNFFKLDNKIKSLEKRVKSLKDKELKIYH